MIKAQLALGENIEIKLFTSHSEVTYKINKIKEKNYLKFSLSKQLESSRTKKFYEAQLNQKQFSRILKEIVTIKNSGKICTGKLRKILIRINEKGGNLCFKEPNKDVSTLLNRIESILEASQISI